MKLNFGILGEINRKSGSCAVQRGSRRNSQHVDFLAVKSDQTMGEFTVHRVRFFDYMPSAIRALAFNSRTEKIALVRADSSVEFFNFKDNYFQENVIPGKDSQSVEALCWLGDRLFSAGLNGEITEYDLEALRPKYSLDAYGGPVWSLTCHPQGTHLAVGCEDGTVKLFEVLEDGIQFERHLERQKGRIISLAWHPSGSQIAAGMMDMIKVFDVKSGQSVHRLLVDRGVGSSKAKECVVWSVVFLSDHTLVSGDSSGKVQVWDGQMGTLVKTHLITKWDVLALSVSPDECSLVAGTSEGTVVQFQFLAPCIKEKHREWIRTRTFKNHTHDVRTLVEIGTAVISGGMDTQLVVRPLLGKVEKNTQESALRMINFPHRSLVSCARKAGLLLFQFPGHLEVWRLGEGEGHAKPGERLAVKKRPEKLLHLKRKGEYHVCCSTLSPCGGWLAYATVTSVRVYRLQYDNNTMSVTKVTKLPQALRSATQLCFSSDSSRLFAAGARSEVVVVSVGREACQHLHTLKPPSDSRQAARLLCTSEDGRWLASASSNCEVHVYNLRKLKYHSTVPVYSSCPSAIAIHPVTNNLFITHADQQMFEYSILHKEYTVWSRRLQRQGLHHIWFNRDTPVTHVTFNPRNPAHVILQDMYMFCLIDQSLPLPDEKDRLLNQLVLKSLPEEQRLKQSHAFKISKTFQHMLSLSLLEDQSMVVVERPMSDITMLLPPPVRQKKFAT